MKQQYLQRIRYQGSLPVNLTTLRALQAAHLLHVPFENLDLHLGRKIALAGSYDKIVKRGRGGFCYELNGSFYALLRELGFPVRLVSGRVYSAAAGFGPEFDHLAIIATLHGTDYLVDVGFGEFTWFPLALRLDAEQLDPRGRFRIAQHDEHYLVVQKFDGTCFVPEYLFTTAPRELSEFLDMCQFHQTSPASPFTQKRLCSLATTQGRITITDNRLRITEGESITEMPLPDPADFTRALSRYFGIKL